MPNNTTMLHKLEASSILVKWKCRQFEEIFVTDCTKNYQNATFSDIDGHSIKMTAFTPPTILIIQK